MQYWAKITANMHKMLGRNLYLKLDLNQEIFMKQVMRLNFKVDINLKLVKDVDIAGVLKFLIWKTIIDW